MIFSYFRKVWFTGGKLCPARLSSDDGDMTDDEDQGGAIQNKTDDENGYGDFEDWKTMFAKGKWR